MINLRKTGATSTAVALFAATALTSLATTGAWARDKIEIRIEVRSGAESFNTNYSGGPTSSAWQKAELEKLEAEGDTTFRTSGGSHSDASTGPQNDAQANAIGNAAQISNSSNGDAATNAANAVSSVANSMTSASAGGGFSASGSTGGNGHNYH